MNEYKVTQNADELKEDFVNALKILFAGKQIDITVSVTGQPIMPDTLPGRNKLKFKQDERGNREIETEFSDGLGKHVTETITSFWRNGNSALKLNSAKSQSEEIAIEMQEDEEVIQTSEPNNSMRGDNETPLPSINDLLTKLICTEQEWLLLFAYYLFSETKTAFSGKAVKEFYRKNRYNLNRSKNYEANWKKAWKSYFSEVREDAFTINNSGLKKAQELITGKVENSDQPKDEKKRARNNKNPVARKVLQMIDFNFTDKERDDLRSFFVQKAPIAQDDIVLVLTYWFKHKKSIDKVTANTIFTLMRIVDVAVPKSLGTVLGNIAAKNHLARLQAGTYTLHYTGEDYVKLKLPKAVRK